MVVFPHAKINLGLDILSKRDDGYHNISSVFYPLPFEEILEVLPYDDFHFEASGLAIPGNVDDNLIIKAYKLLQEQYKLPPVHIHLHKLIPMGAGLGGGSADAAFVIKALNSLFDLELSGESMRILAGRMGSDCPFFIKGETVLAEGTGTDFSPIAVDLKGKYLVLICPGVHVSTAEAYSKVKPRIPEKSIREVVENIPISEWRHCLKNDFEASVFPAYPEIETVKRTLYDSGAIYASMSGSGSSVYGIFNEEPANLTLKASWKGVLKG
ncbi:4-(cytidine 5'-diphospho)-2-C-methyl-D-erythritol kinase [Fulvivirga sp. 29W222]|uniref:4-diphosphocytidyl-2-C-methyl-D-erythritol kinase n=1 Tax=Fulvivirga marina TaxID=2494733 RepID=A0A937FVK7_9BACT|nr:4-(cytidine 5'-diphospho)-2-C-methyl-D-erythritol kinase [Fulvivirga marina]MBL6445798.1 4-(cytidine 5'-diphospho)-2-C-methyl-D-erythritol kinase [Fulvivirga marina]